MISLETPQRKWASSPLMGEHPGFSRVAAGALDLRWGPQGPTLVASGKAVPMRVARGPLRIPLPSMPGPKTLCGVGAGTWGFLSRADMDLGVLQESPQGSQSSFEWGH